MSKYDSRKHEEAILERQRSQLASAEAFAGAADASAENEDQIRLRLNEIMGELQEIRQTVSRPDGPAAPRPGTLEAALANGLTRDAKVGRPSANASARAAAEHIRRFMHDNDSRATEEEVTEAVESIPGSDIGSPKDYADAVHDAVSKAVLEPGRGLPHDMRALDEAHEVLASCGNRRSDSGDGRGSEANQPGLTSPPPAIASSEIIRDVSHLTTLLLGSSPAFAEAMRVQSDAIAYSLAALNKVGDMQRQDALGLAITANAAAAQFNRR